MRKFLLAAVLVLMASGAQASSYLDIFGVVHDPIQYTNGNPAPHHYSGPNLQPGVVAPFADLGGADLTNADLSGADLYWAAMTSVDLTNADLSGANLQYPTLGFANLSGANLTNATLYFANLTNANLDGTNLRGADLTLAWALGTTIGTPYYDANTNFTDAWEVAHNYGALFDPVAAGWNLVPNRIRRCSWELDSRGSLLGGGCDAKVCSMDRDLHRDGQWLWPRQFLPDGWV